MGFAGGCRWLAAVARGSPRWPPASRPSGGAPRLLRCPAPPVKAPAAKAGSGCAGVAMGGHGAGRGSPSPRCPHPLPGPRPAGFARVESLNLPVLPPAAPLMTGLRWKRGRRRLHLRAPSARGHRHCRAPRVSAGPRGWRGATGLSPWPVPGRAPRWGSGFSLPSPTPGGREGTGGGAAPPQASPPAWHRCHCVPPGAPPAPVADAAGLSPSSAQAWDRGAAVWCHGDPWSCHTPRVPGKVCRDPSACTAGAASCRRGGLSPVTSAADADPPPQPPAGLAGVTRAAAAAAAA